MFYVSLIVTIRQKPRADPQSRKRETDIPLWKIIYKGKQKQKNKTRKQLIRCH